MFEFLFKYPASVFSKGTFVLLGSWPRWLLFLAIAGLAGLLASVLWRRRLVSGVRTKRAVGLWLIRSALLAFLLLLLWQPAISVTALRPQQNIVAVLVDDSRSMSLKEAGQSREAEAIDLLNRKLLTGLGSRFQVRLYKLSSGVERIPQLASLHADSASTQIGNGLREIANEAATLPIGAVLLLSDGADNTGGIDRDTISELHRRRLPVNTIGFGKQQIENDVEVESLDVPPKALAGSRLQALVTVRQNGFAGKHTRLVLTGGGAVLASRDVTLKGTPEQIETLEFIAGKAGVKNIEVRLDPLPGEVNPDNNHRTRVLSVSDAKRRILYIEGEPRWEYKFLRRAAGDDPALQIVSMLRTTQNKIYRQGIANPAELADGFPSKPEELFAFDGLIIGSVESAFFAPAQQQMIKDFADRRGGGLLFLAGRYALADGGYNVAPFSELLPVNLPSKKNTFQRNFVAAELTDAGRQSLICRIDNDAAKSADHWEVLPYLANYQDPGTPKPGAVVLANVNIGGKRSPLLVTENYGRGRSAVFATAGSWRWRMQQPVGDQSEETFWRQLLRWTAGASPSPVTGAFSNAQLEDNGRAELRAEVRDKNYLPAADADVQANIIQPDGTSQTVPLRPDPLTPGMYSADWNAPASGSYVTEVTATSAGKELGRDVLTLRREDGVEENFHQEQNADLLKKLAEATGGHYYTPHDAGRVTQEISYSEAGITSREMKDLWNMPVVFFLLLGLCATEWFLRRRWGVV